MKPVWVRPLADDDIDGYANHIAHDNLDAALRFIDAVQAGFDRIGDYSGIGSMRYNDLLEGLRVWVVPDFENYLIFYFDHPNYVDVVRVLHGAMDIPVIFQENII